MTTIHTHYILDKYCKNIGLPGVNEALCGQQGLPTFDKFNATYDFPDLTEQVPKVIHFVWIGSPISYKYVKNIEKFVATNKKRDFSFILWVDNDTPSIENVSIKDIRTDFPAATFINKEIYDIETNWSSKADILKYELIYHVGGIYSDLDAHSIKAYDSIFEKSFVCYSEAPYNDIGTCFFGFPAGSRFLRYVIDCLREVRTYSYDYSKFETKLRVVLLTGPILFTQCFKNYKDPTIQMINQDIVVLNKNNPDAYSYHTFDSMLPTGWHNQK